MARMMYVGSIQPVASVGPMYDFGEVSEYLGREEKHDRFSGTVMIQHDDEVVLEGAYGCAHLGFCVPNTMDTRFNLASITKMFTAVAVLQLVEARKLSLQDTIAERLPYLRMDRADRVTVHHLLCHQSGLGSYWNEKCQRQRSTLRSIRAYLSLIEDQELAFEPGSSVLYGNSGYVILGAMIEEAAEQDYYEYVRQHVCTRAAMPRANHLMLDQVTDFAHGYTNIEWEGEDHPDHRTDNIFQYPVRGSPASGLYCSAPELLRFGAALRGNVLLTPGSRELMFREHAKEPSRAAFGYGCQHIATTHDTWVGHGGRSFGAATTFLHLPEKELTVCILSNNDRRNTSPRQPPIDVI